MPLLLISGAFIAWLIEALLHMLPVSLTYRHFSPKKARSRYEFRGW